MLLLVPMLIPLQEYLGVRSRVWYEAEAGVLKPGQIVEVDGALSGPILHVLVEG